MGSGDGVNIHIEIAGHRGEGGGDDIENGSEINHNNDDVCSDRNRKYQGQRKWPAPVD